MIFQDPMTSMNPVFRTGWQVAEPVRLHQSLHKAQAMGVAVSMLGKVGIPSPESRARDYPHQFSGGMRQRAMIAMGLTTMPKVLIADEPTTALDVTIQAQILELLRNVNREFGTATILITHNLGVVAEMCDEVAVMYLGRVVEQGPVDAIFHEPKHPYTRALLRSMPSIKARVRSRLPVIEGSIPHPYNRPAGCAFHPRCPDFMPGRCDQEEPAPRPVGMAQEAACLLYAEAAR